MSARRLRALATIALPCALAACGATVRAARLAQDRSLALPGERTPTAAEVGLPTKGPVALADLVRVAVRIHPTVVQAVQAAEAARARVRAAESARYPQVSTSASASYRDQSGTPVASGAAAHRFASYGFDVSWLLFDAGRTAALTRQAAEQWMSAQQDVLAARQNVAFAVRTAWFNLAKQMALLTTQKESVRQFAEHLDQVRALEKAGKRIPYDVTKAEVDLGTAKLDEVTAADAVLTAEATLATAVGLAEVLDWTPAEKPDLVPTAASFEAAWAATGTRQPAIAAAAARERAAFALVDARVSELYPSISVGLGFGGAGSSSPLPWSLDLGPSIQWVPFDGFQNLSSIEEAAANLRAARAALAQQEQVTWLEVRSAWIGLEDARQRMDLTALTARSAEENLVLAQGRFDAGLSTSLDLTDARQALIEAKTSEIQAKADHAVAIARLARATGEPVPAP